MLDNDNERLKKYAKFWEKTANMRKCLTKFSRIIEFGAVQKCKSVNLVDLVKSFHASIFYLLAQFGFDTAENGPLKVCQKLAKRLEKLEYT